MPLRPQASSPGLYSSSTPIYIVSTASRVPMASANFTSEGWFVPQPTLREVHPAFRSTPPSPDSKDPADSYLQAAAMKEETRRDSGIGRISTSGSFSGPAVNQSLSLNAILETPNASPPQASLTSTGRRIFIPVDRLRSLSLDEVPRWKRRSSTSGSSTRSNEREKDKDMQKPGTSHRGSSYFPSFSPFKPLAEKPLPSPAEEEDIEDFERPISPHTTTESNELFYREHVIVEDASPVSPRHVEFPKFPDEELYLEPDDDEDDIFVYPKTNKYDYPVTSDESEYDSGAYNIEESSPPPSASTDNQAKTKVAPAFERTLPNPSNPGSLISLQSTTPSAFKAHPGQRVTPAEMSALSRWSTDNSSNGSQQEKLQPSQSGSSPKSPPKRKRSSGPVSRPRLLSILKTGNPLLAAAKNGDHSEVSRCLGPGSQLSVIAATDKDGMTALHLAALEGHTDIVRVLINAKAPLDARSKLRERTPVYHAAQNGHVEIVKMLIDAGADIEATGKYDGATALHKACQNGHLDVISLLIKAGADVNRRDVEGMTPMMWAVQGEKLGSAKILLSHGANLEVRIRRGKNLELASKEGLTVLYKVVEKKNRHAFVRIFLEAGADANAEGPNGMRPLHRAASLGDQTNVGMLIEFCADVNLETKDGWTPLHCAARYGQTKIYSMLVRAGADEYKPNRDGQTPRDLGKLHGNEIEFV